MVSIHGINGYKPFIFHRRQVTFHLPPDLRQRLLRRLQALAPGQGAVGQPRHGEMRASPRKLRSQAQQAVKNPWFNMV